MHHTIGVYEAKSKLSTLLHQIKKGHSFTITVRGKEVADLTSSASPEKKLQSTLEAMSALQDKIAARESVGLEFIQAAKAYGRR